MKKRILVIDDDEDILEILNIIFEDAGYEVIVFNQEATIEEIHLIRPDVIILDVMIKGSVKTGDQICYEIKSRAITKDLPVILLSAEYDVSQRALQSGANAYIRKPFDTQYLMSQINEFLV